MAANASEGDTILFDSSLSGGIITLKSGQIQLVRDVTLQIAAANPTVVSREQLDPALVNKEKEIAADQVKNKPPQAVAKIVEGKLEKFYGGVCLLDQGFVKRNSEITVKEHVAATAKQLGDEIVIRRFVRFQLGETATV